MFYLTQKNEQKKHVIRFIKFLQMNSKIHRSMKVNHQNSKWFKAALSLFCLNMAATLDQGKQLFLNQSLQSHKN